MKEIIKAFKNYRRSTQRDRRDYMRDFEVKMIYRTTKTENPELQQKTVTDVLRKFRK
ncbi:MAG: hypothetical protein AAB592_00895 [Patescibacteria group bacterium]